MFGLEMFGLARFTLLSQDLIDLTVMAEPAFSALNTHTFWLARFKNLVFDGAKPQQRVSKNDSKILSITAHRQAFSWVDKGAAKKLELLYCTSNDGWNAADIHSRCDNKGPTVTAIKCTGGYVFGVFTSTAWASADNSKTCADAFVFSLRRPGGVGPVKLGVKAAFAHYVMYDDSSCFNVSDGLILTCSPVLPGRPGK